MNLLEDSTNILIILTKVFDFGQIYVLQGFNLDIKCSKMVMNPSRTKPTIPTSHKSLSEPTRSPKSHKYILELK